MIDYNEEFKNIKKEINQIKSEIRDIESRFFAENRHCDNCPKLNECRYRLIRLQERLEEVLVRSYKLEEKLWIWDHKMVTTK